MDKKTTGIVAYITFIGLLVALLAGDREGAKFHINQSLVIWVGYIITGILGNVPLIGWLISTVLSIFLLVCVIVGIIGAIQDEEREAPIIGQIKLFH